MKVAITFFGKKREKNKNLKDKYINLINQKTININKYQVIIILVVGIVIAFNSNNMLYLATNICNINFFKVSKEDIISLNGIANKSNYKFSIVEEKEDVKENISDDMLAMDKIAEEYNEQMVFNNISKSDINIVADVSTYQKLNICGIDITNYSTNRNIDFESIFNSEDIFFNKQVDKVALYTTHTSESYANSQNYKFEYTSPRRSVDGNYNMLAISSTLSENLNSKNIKTINSLTPHDYGEYNSAYTNSRMTLATLLEENEDIAISIDVHRDAIEDLEFAPKVNIKGYDVAAIMLVMGIGYEGQENPYYMRNLKLALELQELGNKIYPGLFRPMIIRNSIYNQDLKANSFLVEVGASGNTIEEAKLATRCLANLLNILYKD